MQGKQKNREEILKDIFGQEEWEKMQDEIQNKEVEELEPKHQDLLKQADGTEVEHTNLPVKYEKIELAETENLPEEQAIETIELEEPTPQPSFWDFTGKKSAMPEEEELPPWETMEHTPFAAETEADEEEENPGQEYQLHLHFWIHRFREIYGIDSPKHVYASALQGHPESVGQQRRDTPHT